MGRDHLRDIVVDGTTD